MQNPYWINVQPLWQKCLDSVKDQKIQINFHTCIYINSHLPGQINRDWRDITHEIYHNNKSIV